MNQLNIHYIYHPIHKIFQLNIPNNPINFPICIDPGVVSGVGDTAVGVFVVSDAVVDLCLELLLSVVLRVALV